MFKIGLVDLSHYWSNRHQKGHYETHPEKGRHWKQVVDNYHLDCLDNGVMVGLHHYLLLGVGKIRPYVVPPVMGDGERGPEEELLVVQDRVGCQLLLEQGSVITLSWIYLFWVKIFNYVYYWLKYLNAMFIINLFIYS